MMEVNMQFEIIATNFAYALLGTIITVIAMAVGYKLFDKITPFKTAQELDNQNVAVGIVVGSIFIGLGIAVGLTIGMGLN